MKKAVSYLLFIPLLLLIGLVLTDLVPYLRGPAPETPEWYWPYLLRPFSQWWAAGLTAGLVGLVGYGWLSYPAGRTPLWLTLLALAHLLFQLGLVYADNPQVYQELLNRSYSHLSGGYFTTAVEWYETGQTQAILSNYPDQMPTFFTEHARTHPPGLPLLNWLIVALFSGWSAGSELLAPAVWHERCIDLWLVDRPPAVAAALAVVSLLPLLLASCTIPLAYGFGRALCGHPAGQTAALWTAALPALALFAGQSDQLFAPLTLLIFWLTYQALTSHPRQPARPVWLILTAGLGVSLASFLSFGNLALLLPLAIFVWGLGVYGQWSWARLITLAGVALAGVAAGWLVYGVVWGVPLWEMLAIGLEQHYQLVTLKRQYSWWVGWNLVDLLIFGGWPLVLFLLVSVRQSGVTLWRREKLHPAGWLALALVVLVLALTLSGSARGEVGRLWLFFMPLLAVAAAPHLRQISPQWSIGVWVAQLGLVVALGVAWRPVQGVAVTAIRPEQPPLPVPFTTLNHTFRPEITLTGYTLEQTEQNLVVTHIWQAHGYTTRPYTVFNHLVNTQGQLVAQADGWPVQGQWPATCWSAGEQIVDRYELEVAGLPAGEYRLVSGLYDARDGFRLGEVELTKFLVE